MSRQSATATPGAPAVTPNDPAHGMRGSDAVATTEADTPATRQGDSDPHDDPSLEGIPREVIENVGAYDTDAAGGCG